MPAPVSRMRRTVARRVDKVKRWIGDGRGTRPVPFSRLAQCRIVIESRSRGTVPDIGWRRASGNRSGQLSLYQDFNVAAHGRFQRQLFHIRRQSQQSRPQNLLRAVIEKQRNHVDRQDN